MTDSKDIVVTQEDQERRKLCQQRFLTERISHGQVLDEELARHRIASTEAERARADKAEERLREAVEALRRLMHVTEDIPETNLTWEEKGYISQAISFLARIEGEAK